MGSSHSHTTKNSPSAENHRSGEGAKDAGSSNEMITAAKPHSGTSPGQESTVADGSNPQTHTEPGSKGPSTGGSNPSQPSSGASGEASEGKVGSNPSK